MKEVEKIREFFESINCRAIAILKTERAGEEVDNGCGLEFGLPEYAVIHKNALNKNNLPRLYEFESKESIEIMHFEEFKCLNGIEGLINELKEKDDYQIKWRQHENLS